MFKRSIYTCFVLIAGVFSVLLSNAQNIPDADYTIALPDGTNAPEAGGIVCPSLSPGNLSVDTFRVDAVAVDVGNTYFQWVVYGGSIVYDNGIVPSNSAAAPQSAGGNTYFYISNDNYTSGSESKIAVLWDEHDVLNAWVAVRQFSEWGCSDGNWSVYTLDVFNQKPDLTVPSDISIAYDNRVNFVLPVPGYSNPDACLTNLSFSYNITGAVTLSGDSTIASRTVTLGVGDNIIEWTISDGLKDTTDSYVINVDPDLSILNVAWINPHCGDNGSAFVTNVTDDGSNAYAGTIEYSFNGGTYWRVAPDSSGLASGAHTIQARIVYNSDTDNDGFGNEFIQLSDEYTYELHANSASSVDDVPAEGVNAVVVPTSCSGATDGEISVAGSVMVPQNNSVAFNGAGDYVLLNKSYAASLTAFSISTWIKTSASSGTILSFDNSEYYHLDLSLGRIRLTTRTDLDEINTITVIGADVNNNQWHHVAVSYDGVNYNIYIDGELVKTQAHAGSVNIGKGTTRYGMIGTLSTVSTFSNSPQGFYFSGQISDLGIWDSYALSAADATTMFTMGIINGGPDDFWAFDDVPSNISASYGTVFTDLGNAGNAINYGRFYGCSLSANNTPKLYFWTDDPSIGITDRSDLAVGSYTLNVSDIFGCSTQTETYNVTNGDSEEPLILWNVAIEKTANQSSTALVASLANDGLFDTNSATNSELEPWWDVSLANNYPVRMVRVTANAAVANVWVMVSPSPFTGATLADDLAATGVQSKSIASISAGGTEYVAFNVYGRYVRIRVDGTTTLDLYEVEVLTNYTPATRRTIYLTDDCDYTLSVNDVTIDPIVYDDCGGVSTLTNDFNTTSTIVGETWSLGETHTVVWTATDDNTLESTLSITYEVVDEVPPVFESPAFDGVPNNFTYCEGLVYQFPIPDVTDNIHHCAAIQSITLYRDGWLAYSVDIGTYDHTSPGLVPAIPTHMKPGDHTMEWEVVDFEGNTISSTYNIHVEVQPLLREVKVSPITCNGDNNAIVYFSNIESEPAAMVDYILRPINGIDPDVSQNTSTFSPAPVGNYRALISVNGCESNVYSKDVIISNPSVVTLNEDVGDVVCFGQSNGTIDLYPTGGSQTNILHLYTDGRITASNYAALDLTNSGTIECWIFLDSLASGGINDNAHLFGVGSSYGLHMVGSQLRFYAGSASVTAGAGAISQRAWHHITGDWTWNGVDAGTITLYIDGGIAASAVLAVDPAVPAGGGVYIGYNGADYLSGFVRNARVWSSFPTMFGENMRLVSPIDPDGYLVANYAVNESGGTSVVNSVSGGSSGSISGTHNNQRFAFYWLNPDGSFLSFNKNLTGLIAGDYNVTLYDPLGCTLNTDVTVGIDDDDPPTMTFFSDHDRITTPLGVGVPVIRYTSDVSGGGNVDTDCYYFPYGLEFDPVVSDGACPSSGVTLSYVPAAGSEAWGVPAPVGGEQSLDGIGMTGIIILDWTATDPNGQTATEQVTYYTIDDQDPVSLTLADATRTTDIGDCNYTVAAGDLIPVLSDNCGVTTGRLYNNLNNSDNLDGYTFAPGVYTITWNYDDKTFPDFTPGSINPPLDFTLTVIDEQLPVANCVGPFDTYLDEFGESTIDYLEIDNGSSDNCGAIASYNLTKNIAYYLRIGAGSATQSSYDNTTCGGTDQEVADRAIDGITDGTFTNCSSALTQTEATESWWQVNLNASSTIYAVNVYGTDLAGAGLDNFWLVVSSDGTFGNSGDMSTPVWSADVTYAVHYTSGALGSNLFSFETAITGQYVRIWNDHVGPLAIAEVEVYGSAAPASSIVMDCFDVRYTPAADTGQPGVYDDAQGTFGPTGLLLTIIDDDGNAASCLTDITVNDWIGPTVVTQNVTLEVDAVSGEINLDDYVDDINDGSSDACGIETMWVSSPDKTCVDIGNQTVTFNVRDIYGNSSTRTAAITISDTEAPTVTTGSNIILYLDDDGQYTIDVENDIIIPNGVTDNCDAPSELIYTATPATVICADRGYIDLTIEVTDLSGNTRTITLNAVDNIVQVVDNRPPIASLQSFELIIPEDGDSLIRFQDLIPDVNLYDNCDGYGVDIPVKQIKYTSADSWCDAGNEGTDGTNAFTNIADNAGVVTGNGSSSAAYGSTSLSNLNDNAYSTADADIYISNATSGTRQVFYYLDDTYEFDQSSVSWHEESMAPSISSIYTNTSLLPNGNITSNVGTDAGNPLTELRDLNWNGNNEWYTSGTGTNAQEFVYVTYQFTSTVTITSTRMQWDYTPQTNTYPPYVEYSTNGSTWTSMGTLGSNTGTFYSPVGATYPIEAVYIRIVFDRANGTRGGIREWEVLGYSGSIQYDCDLPNSNTLYYSSNGGTDWTSAGSFSMSSANTFYNLSLGSISANAFRIDMTTSSSARVGIQEWRLNGRAISAESACTKYSCSDLSSSPVPVWLQWADEAGNYDSTQVLVDIVPYFNIRNIDLKDCGYDGERFYPTILNLDETQTNTYSWTVLEDNGGQNVMQDERLGGGCQYVTSMERSDQNWAQGITTGCTPYPANGDYAVGLTVTDDNGCFDSYTYYFSYIQSTTQGTSIDSQTVCLNDIDSLAIYFTEPWEFWRESENDFYWNLGTIEADSAATVISGGQTGDFYVKVRFDRSTLDYGTTTNLTYQYRARRFNGQVNSTSIETVTGSDWYTDTQYTLIVQDSLTTGGPYFTEDNAQRYRTLTVGTKYVETTGNSWFGDYTNCLESRQYRITVLEVTPPVVEAYDAYGTGTWVSASTLDVCPRDTIWYRVSNMVAGEYAYLNWSWTNGSSEATGRRLAQGNYYDDSIRIVWDQVPIQPMLTVIGYNELDCSSQTSFTLNYTDVDPPVLRGEASAADNDCSALNATHTNNSGQCGYTFQNLPAPILEDDCHDWIETYWCEIDTDGDSNPDFTGTHNAQGYYPVGVSTVTWYATDYSGKTGSCAHTVTVTDTEDPSFNKVPTNITLYADATGVQYITATTHDLIATDNCALAVGEPTARIDMGNDGSWDYTGLTQISDPTSLRPFPFGVSLVEWSATDIYGNSTTETFTVTVRDNTKPTIAALADITHDNEPGFCLYDFAGSITYPTDPAQLDDNVSSDAYLATTVEFVSRNDGLAEADPYDVGTTIISWRVTDESGNYGTQTQNVIISDTEAPTFDAGDAALQNLSKSYCTRKNFRLSIPLPDDNCGITNVASITYEVTGGKGPLSYSKTINRANGTFNPNGTGLTDSIPNFYQYVNTYAENNAGSDFVVTWSAIDEDGNTSADYSYNLHIEIEPVFSEITTTPMTCGGADDAVILITTNASNTAAYHYDRNYTPEFSIRNGSSGTWYAQESFAGLSGGSYNVKMRVNGCVSATVLTTSIAEPTPYTLALSKTDVLCPEHTDGSIDLSMGGGASGQLHFNGGAGFAAATYAQIDLTTDGSLCAWVYLDNLDNGTLFSKGGAYGLAMSGGNFQLNVGGSSLTASGFTPIAEFWYYVVATWNASATEIFVNGASVATGSGATASTNASSFSMGAFDGILRDVSVWDAVIAGDVPAAPYTGKESNLVGLWQLNYGIGTSAYNSTQTNDFGNDATGSATLWTSVMPQPGYFTWEKNTAYYSDLINLDNLGIGDYSVLFVDPYGCPNTITDPLTESTTIVATDNVAPVIEDLINLNVSADGGVCYYQVSNTTESDALIPTITDAEGCNFDITWTVVTDYNLSVWSPPSEEYRPSEGNVLNNLIGAKLDRNDLNGVNTVTVTTLQNGDVTSTEVYTITVTDDENPVADGDFDTPLTLDLDEFGNVSLSAVDFNDNSSDNCSDPDEMIYELWDGDSWESSIDFDCSAIGRTVDLQFRVTDQVGLWDIDSRVDFDGLVVSDITAPQSNETSNQPLGPYCATFDAVGPVPAYVPLSVENLKLENYSDNCGVTGIRYRLDHESYAGGDVGYSDIVDIVNFDPATMVNFYQGTTTVYFEIYDDSGNIMPEQSIFIVTVLPKPNPSDIR